MRAHSPRTKALRVLTSDRFCVGLSSLDPLVPSSLVQCNNKRVLCSRKPFSGPKTATMLTRINFEPARANRCIAWR